jgi:hypothetical protein
MASTQRTNALSIHTQMTITPHENRNAQTRNRQQNSNQENENQGVNKNNDKYKNKP